MSTEAFLIIFMAFWAVIALVPLLFRRFKIPAVIVLLVTGMLIGPNCFGLLNFLSHHLNFLGVEPETIRAHSLTMVNSLGSLGLVFLMTLAGLEADFKLIRSVRLPTILLSIFTFFIPALAGYLVYAHFVPEDMPGKLLYASLFASHSVGIVFPVIRELKLSKTRFGAAVLISTVITDIGSIILLAVSVQLKRQATAGTSTIKSLSLFDYIDPSIFGNFFLPMFLILALVYMGASCWLVNRIGNKVLKALGPNEDALVTFFLFIIMVSVMIGEFLGINLVVGAFIAGLGLSKVVKSIGPNAALFSKMEGIGYSLLIPFLFISIGMKTDFTLLFHSAGNVSIIVYTIIGLVFSKVLSGFLAMILSGFRPLEGLCAGLMTVPQLSATLAAAAIGKDLGMLSDDFFNAIVVLSIVTTLPIPNMVRFVIEKFHLTFRGTAVEPYQVPETADQDELW